MTPSEQQELVEFLRELSNPLVILVLTYLRNLQQEIQTLMRGQIIRKRKIQELHDLIYMDTHTACRTCGALPNKRARMETGEQDYKRRPGCVRQSKL